METKFKTVFAGQIRAIQPTEETRNEVKASLSRLRDLLPANINPEDEPALLFVAGNLAVAGLVNKNDDGYDIDTALATYKKFVWQQINLEHDRKHKVGFIVHAGLSEFGTDRIITEDEARASGKPFNVAVVMALWRVGEGSNLCEYIEEASTPTHPDFNALSLSFEMGFDGYYIAALPKDTPIIAQASMMVKPGESTYARFDESLRANKGSGLSPDDANQRIYRVINEGVIPLGGGIVTMPAAAVQGLVAIVKKPEPIVPQQDGVKAEEERIIALALEEAQNTARMFFASLTEKIETLLKSPQSRVSLNTSINSPDMKHSDLQALKQLFATASKVTKMEEITTALAGVNPIIDAITAESERQEAARLVAEKQAAEVAAAKAQIEATNVQMTKDLEAVRKELAGIKQVAAAAAAEEAFNNRMADLESVFDLDDDTRAYFASEVKSCDTDEAYAAKKAGFLKVMKEKTKDAKKKKSDDDAKVSQAAQAALIARLGEKGVTAKFADDGTISELIASAIANPTSSAAGSIEQPVNTGDLKELAQKALKGITFGQKK